MGEYSHQRHPFAPVWNADSEILILGSFPSVKSRQNAFYYGHPRNRFWTVLAAVLEQQVPVTVEEKRQFLLKNHIALWDVIASCDIAGSSDSSIRSASANPVGMLLEQARIKRIFLNGATAEKLYNKYLLPQLGIPGIRLPSTSPANASWSGEKLCQAWKVILAEGKIPSKIENNP